MTDLIGQRVFEPRSIPFECLIRPLSWGILTQTRLIEKCGMQNISSLFETSGRFVNVQEAGFRLTNTLSGTPAGSCSRNGVKTASQEARIGTANACAIRGGICTIRF